MKVYCKDCKHYNKDLIFRTCLDYAKFECCILADTEIKIENPDGVEFESPIEDKVLNIIKKKFRKPTYYWTWEGERHSGYIRTEALNEKGKCKFYQRKWWKVWIKRRPK
jgi:hypothetical protein